MKKLIAVAVMSMSVAFGAAAHSTGPSVYDKTQDVKIKDLQVDQVRQDKATATNLQTQQTRDAGQDTRIQQAHEKADYNAVRMDGQDKHINAVQEVAQNASVHADALAVRADDTDKKLAVTDDRSINNAVRLDGAESVNDNQSKQIGAEVQSRIEGDKYNSTQIVTANQGIQRNSQGLSSANSRIDNNTATLSNHEQRIGDLEYKGNKNFRDLNHRIDRLDKRLDAGVSTALATAGIPQVTGEQRFALGAAVGGYESGSAIAVGFSSRVTESVVIKAAVATDNQQGVGYNAGLSVGW